MSVLHPPDDTLVAISRTNTAHVLDPEGHWLCNLFRPEGVDAFDQAVEDAVEHKMRWWENQAALVDGKPWRSWPCQTCCARLLRS